MVKPVQLPSTAINILVERMKDEMSAFYFYMSAAAWCRLNGYDGAAMYFSDEQNGEEWHYKRIVSFLSDWNCPVKIEPIKEPVKTFSSLIDIFEKAYSMEVDLGEKYERDALRIFPICQKTYNFIQEFVNVQGYSVVSADKVLKIAYGFETSDKGMMEFDSLTFKGGGASSIYNKVENTIGKFSDKIK